MLLALCLISLCKRWFGPFAGKQCWLQTLNIKIIGMCFLIFGQCICKEHANDCASSKMATRWCVACSLLQHFHLIVLTMLGSIEPCSYDSSFVPQPPFSLDTQFSGNLLTRKLQNLWANARAISRCYLWHLPLALTQSGFQSSSHEVNTPTVL